MRLQQDSPREQTVRLRSGVKVYYHVALDEHVDLAGSSCRTLTFCMEQIRGGHRG